MQLTSTQAKVFARRFIESAINRGDLLAAEEMIAPRYIPHNPRSPLAGQVVGPELVKDVISTMRSAFPDLEQTIEDLIAEGDQVVVRSTFRGTHQGSFMGIAATGRHMSMGAVEIFRLEDGRCAEHWIYADDLGLLQQLGALAAPGAPAQPARHGRL